MQVRGSGTQARPPGQCARWPRPEQPRSTAWSLGLGAGCPPGPGSPVWPAHPLTAPPLEGLRVDPDGFQTTQGSEASVSPGQAAERRTAEQVSAHIPEHRPLTAPGVLQAAARSRRPRRLFLSLSRWGCRGQRGRVAHTYVNLACDIIHHREEKSHIFGEQLCCSHLHIVS